MLPKLTSRKGTNSLRFPRFFEGLNGYETYIMSYTLVIPFQQDILSKKIQRDDQDTHFQRKAY